MRRRFYKCKIGISQYGTNINYFIPGKIYRCEEESALIDEFGDDHYIHSSILETHFKPLISNKRKRNVNKERGYGCKYE